jgi:hypothetical protein
MTTYEICCFDCKCVFEQFRSMKDGPEYICENCQSTNVGQMYSLPDLCIKQDDPTDVVHLANRNRDSMSQNEFTEKRQEQLLQSKKGQAAMRAGNEKPWGRKHDPKKLARLNEVQKQDYINTGSLPDHAK